MIVYRSSEAAARDLEASAVAIGSFDGIHLGHRALFARTIELARQGDIAAAVLTFDPHPARFFRPQLAPPLISTEEQKLHTLQQCGLDATIVQRFDRALANQTPAEFVKRLLVDQLRVRHVVVGSTFVFGHNRSGNLAVLQQLAEAHGFVAHGIQPIRVDSIVVSSTKIREFILMGRVDGAAMLLGAPFEVEGRVEHGAGRGRQIGIPTANIHPDNEILPAKGVYAAHAHTDDGHRYQAVVNIGTAPTFAQGGPVRLEAHLLDYSGDLFSRRLTIAFVQRLRDERRFESAAQLVSTIQQDIAKARDLLRG